MAKIKDTTHSPKMPPPLRIDVHHWLHNEEMQSGAIPQLLTEILTRIGVLEAQGQQLMAIAQSTQAKLDAIDAALDAAAQGLAADIQALKDALNAASNGMSEADVNAALAPLEARAQALADLDAQNPPPPTP